MTANEKAATYIGWPGEQTQCMYHKPCLYRPPCTGARKMEAPDMSDPRNYMKAAGKAYRDSLFIEGDPRMTAFERGLLMTAIEDALYQDDTAPIIKYLSALYNAEHPE